MHRGAAIVLSLLAVLPARAQQPVGSATVDRARAEPPEPLPHVVVDLHGALAGLPAGDGWVPPVSAVTPRPGHGLGVSAGAHVYVVRLRFATIGMGVSVLTARNAAEALISATTGAATTPTVTTRVTSLHPQISLNFGHRYGWSYVSGGVGRTKIVSTSTGPGALASAAAPALWNPAINYGGGARWFMKPHLAASFDVRITQLGSRQPTSDYPYFALRSKLVNFLVGISVQ